MPRWCKLLQHWSFLHARREAMRDRARYSIPRHAGKLEPLEPRMLLSSTPIVVDDLTDRDDDNTGAEHKTLRDAIAEAAATPGADTITFSETAFGTAPVTIQLVQGALMIDDPDGVTIQGPGADLLTIQGDGGNAVFDLPQRNGAGIASQFTLSRMKLSGGTYGLNIRPANGDHQVELDQLLISDNTTGGIHSLGDLRVANSAIVENDGVGISSSLGDLVVVNTTVSGNRTATGATAGIYSGFRTNTTLRNVTVTNNHALADETDPALISEAQAIEAGLWSVVTLHNSIVTDNYAGQSPVIMADLDYYDYTQPGPPDGRIDPDSSFNLIGYAAAGAFSPNNATNLVGVPGGTDNPDAKLAPLASNGSPLKTHALLPGSDAINAGSEGLALESDGATPLEYDQRGRGNPRVLGPAVDIGAFEALYEPALHLTANPDVTSIDETASTVAQIVATITPHQLGSDFAPSDFVLRGADADLFEVVTHADAPFALRLRAGQPIDFGISPVLDVTVETVSAGVTYAAGFSLPVNALYPSIPTTQISQGLQDAIRDSLGFTDADRPLQTGDLARVIELYGDPAQIGDLEGLAQLVNLERLVLAPRSFDTAGGPLELGPSVKNDLGNLTYVQIQGAGITDAGLAALADWLPTGVETLDLLYNEVTSLPSDLLASNRLPDLQELRLHGNPIAEPGRALANEDGTNNPLEALKGSLVQLDIVSADPDLAVYAEGENDPVKDLARRLYYLPTRMFEWVRNNVELDIYHGFIRSAQAVLETRRANDFDTALLLKELLEHSGFTYGTDLHLRYSLVDAPASAVKHWLGVQNTEAALDVLGLMSPKDDLPSLANDDSIVFNHAYLEWRPTPNGATLVLDPSWKFKDLASEAHELLRNLHRDHDLGVDGELKFEENDFNHADDSDRDGNNLNDGFLDRERPVDASDFYADQVRRHLAANYTGSTVAEVSYDGPIIPVAVSDLGTPLHDWSRVDTVQLQSVRSGSNLSVSANTVVDAYLSGDRDLWVDLNADPQTLDPVSLAHGVAIKIAPTSATPPNTLREAIDDGFSFVALEEFARHAWVTKSTPTANGHTIRLYRDGEVYAPVQPINLASGQSEYRLIVKTYTPAAYGQDLFSYSPNLNVIRQINQLVTFGVDAGQDSVYSIARKRAEYTEAVTRRLESPFDPGVTGDLNLSGTAEDEDVTIIGALADLTQTEYQFRTREAEAKLAGLFGFVDNLTFLGLGTVTADIEDGYQIEETLQSRILPDQLWVDQSAITAVTQLIGVTETYVNENLFGAQNATSFLTGYRRAAAWISSGYEHEVIEDITNAASAASTVKAIQIANSHGSGVIEVTSLSQANALVTFQNPEPNSTEAGYNNAVGRIRQGFANGGTLISAIIPRPQDLISITDGSGSLWFGYYLDRANGKEFKISSDSIVDDINGGLTVTPVRPDSTPPIEVRTNQTTGIGDPVNPADGHVYHVETDVVIPNQGVPIAFARKYQSTHVDDDLYYDSDRGLGRGWSFSYSDRLEFANPTSTAVTGGRIEHAADPDPDPEEPDHPVRSLIDGIVWYAGDGTRHVFELDSGGAVTNDARHFVSKTMYGRLAELQNSEGLVTGYRFIDPAGMSYRFDAVGRLTQIADNFGDGVMVMHGGNGQIESVQDLRATGNDQQLSFDWTGGNLTLSDHTGREWFFEVKDPNGLNHDALTRVTARGSNGSGADDLSSTYTYYEDPVRKSLLKDVWQGRKGSDGADTTEAKQTSYEYYANRRAMRVTLPDDRREHFWYRLGLYGTTAENEGSADERAVTFGRDFAGAVTTFVDGSGDIVRYSIADTGEVLRETFFDSTTRQAEWNDRGQQLAITDAYGQTETFDYDDNLHRSTSGVYSASNEISGDSFVSGVLLEQEDREGREMLYHYGGYTNSSLTSRASELIYQPDEGGSYHLMPLVEIRDLGGVDRIVAKFDHEYSSDGGATYLDPAPGNGLFDNANDDGLRFRLINQIDALNHVTEYRYVGASIESLPTEVERPGTGSVGDLAGSQASLTRYLYNAAGQVIAEGLSDPADPAPAIVSLYSYDDAGRLVAQVSPNEVAEITGLTFGAPIVNGQGDPLHPEQTTSFKYDTHGRLVSTRGVDPDKVVPAQDEDLPSPFTKQEYDARGNVTRSHIYDNGGANQATADGALVTETIYDDQDRPVLMTYADGTQQRMTYDGVGRLSTQTDALGRTTRLTYDRRGRLSATVLPDGSIVRQRVDGGGRVVATTDPNGNTTKLHYDVLGRLIKQVDPAPADKPASEDVRSTEWVYDARGNLASIVDARDNRTLFAYDDLDRVTHTVNALGAKQADSDGDGLINNTSQGALDGLDHTVKTKYDARGNVIESTDPNDNTTQSFYDFANRLIETTTSDPDGDLSSGAGALTTKFVYDDNGNLTQVLVEPDGNVAVTVTEYDRLNRAIKVTQPDPDGSGNQASPEVESVFDALGRLIRTIDPNDNPTAYEHDKLGRVIAVIDAGDDNHPDGNRYATFYDAAGQVIATETPLGEISRTEYDRLGRVVRETAPDPDGPGPQGTSTITFVYDDAGNLVSSTDARGNVTSYRYDNRNRLVQTIYPSTDTPPDVIEITGDTYVRGGGFANNTQAAIGHESSNEIFVKNAGDHQPQFDRVGVLRIDVPDSLIDLINSPKGLHRDVDLVLELELVSAANAPAPDNTNATQTEQHIYLLNESLSGDLAAKTWNSLLPGVGDPVVSADHDTLADYGQLLASTTIAVGEHSSGRVSLTLSDGPNRQALIDHIAANGSLSLIIGGPAVGDGVLVKYASSESGNEADQPRLRVQGPLAPTQDLSYDAVGNVISTTDELGRTWLYGYDELNRQVRETAPADHDQPGLFWEVWRDRDWRQHIHSTSTFKGIDLEDPGATGVRSDGQFLTGFSSGRQEYFVYRHTAIFEIESAGEYVFDLSANDGARIYIDDQFLLDITNPYNSAGGWESGGDSIWLDAGEHFLVVDYLQHVDARGISVKYTGPDTSGAQVHLNTEGSFVLPGPTSRQEYDANGNLVKTIDPNGNETLYFYDALNRLVRTVNAEVEGSGQSPDANGVGADNYTVETVYDTRGRVVLTIDELGREYGTMYDNLNRVVASIAPDPATGLAFAGDASASRFAALAGDDSQIVGRVTTYTYDDAGNLLSVVDPLGRASYTQYDQLHRPIATVNPAAEEAGLVVDSDADGEIDLSLETPELSQFLTETVYDALGRVVLAVDELGREYGTVYDALGRVAIQVDPHPVSGKAFHSRDAADLGNADRVVGLATRFTYDLNGNLTAVTDPLNQTTWTVYDERNRATRQVNALAEINPADTTQKLDLDPDGNGELNTELVPDLDHYSTVTTYDDANQLVLVTDELGRQYGTVYDQQGRVIAETMPSTETEEVVIQEIDFGSTAIQSFHDGEQDDTDTSVFTVEDDGATLRLTGNAWKYIDLGSLVITPQTVLEFDFASSTKGELHGIGFEKVLGNVNNIWTGSTGQVSRYFQLANADLGVFTDSEIDFDHNVDAGFKPFRIHLADLLGEGSEFDRMVFVADDDAASIGESVFRNVRFTEQTAAVATARYAYDDNGNLVGSQDAEGRTSYTFYDRLNRPTHTVNADAKALVDGEHADPTHSGYLIPDNPYASALDGFTVKTTYDAASQVVLVTDEEGRQYGTVYDRAGRVLADVAPDAATGFAFNGAGFVAGLSLDPRLTPEAPTLDAVLAAAGLVGRTTTYTYDSADQLLSVTDALRNDTHPQGQTAWSFYDALGRLTYTVDERGDAWVDPGDIKVAAWTPGESLPAGDPEPTKNGDQNGDGHPDFAVRREYDPVGRLVGYTDPNGHTTSYAYDHADRQTVMTDSLGKNDAYRYDDNGNLVYTINRAGEQFTYAYDELNRMEIEQWFAADADPEADSPLRWFEYTYRDDSQVESVSEFDNINTAVALQTDAYTYDVAGRLLTETIDRRDSNIPTVVFTYAYDESDRPVSVTDSLNGVTSYTYDDQGRVKTVTQSSVAGDSSPATRVTYTYNLAGQMQTAVHAAEAPGQPSSSVDYITTHFSLYEYDQAGRLHRLTHHNDSDNPLDGANVTPARIIARYTYDRDALDRPDNIDHFAPPSIPGERTTDYTYDPAGQILGAVITNPDPTDPLVANNEDESYTYDGAGNRLTDNGDATTTADDTDVVTAEGSNRLESDGTYSYTYDDAGRLTQRDAIDSDISEKYDWDHRGRLTGITKLDNGQPLSGTFYVYDAQDRLVRRTDWSGLSSLAADTAYFYVGNERRLSVDLSQESKPVTRYLNAPGSETPTAVLAPATTPGGSDDRTYWLLADAAGTVRDVLDGGSSIAVPGEVIVFENGFETSSNPGTTSLGVSGSWSSNFRIATTPGSSARKFLGEYAESEFVTLQLTNLPEEHGKLRISFDLYVLKTWDGVDASAGSPDEFSFTIDGDELLKASFSNVAGNGLGQPQSYGEGEVGRLPHDTDIIYLSQSGAEERNTLGYTLNPEFYTDFIDPDTGEPTVTDSVYRLTFLVDHTATSALLKFASSGLDPAWDESWGIDNLEVAVVDSTTVEVADHIEYAQFGEVLGRSQNDQVVLDAISADGFGFGFQGRAQDGTTGLTHHNARWADPKSGRFLTEDPSGFTFGDPNLYRYVGNAPSVYADPTGLAFIKNGSSYAADSSVFSGPLTGSFGNPSTGNGGLGDPFSGLAITANVSGFDQGGTNYDGGLLLVGLGASGSSPATIQAPTSQSGLTFDDLGPMGQLHLSLGTVSPTPKPTGPTLRGFVESLKQAANETKDTFDQKYALDIEWEINRIQNLEQQYYAALDSGDTLVAGRLLNSIRSANRYFTEGIAQDEDLIADLFKRADHANFQRRLPELQAQALRDAEEAYQRELDEIYEEHGAFGVFIRDAVARQEIFANTLTFGATDKLGLTNSSQYVGDSFNVTRITAGIYREALITGATLGSGALVQAGRGGLALRGVSYAGRAYEGYQAARSGISGYANILQGNYGKGSLELATGLLSSAGAVGRIGNVKPSGGGSLQIGLSKQSSSVPESLRGAYPNGVLDDYLTFHKSVSTATALTQSPRIVVLNEHMWKNVWTPGQRWTVLEEELFHLRNITKYAEGGRLDRFHQTLLNTHLGRAVEEARARYHSSGRLRHSIEYGVRYKAGNHTVGLAEVTWRGLARDGLVLSTGFVGLAGLANATKSLIVNALGDDR